MWWKIAQITGLIFLGAGALQDIKDHEVSVEYLITGTCAAVLYRAFFSRMSWQYWIAGMCCGIGFFILSKWSEEGIGYGDSWMIMNLGIFLGVWRLMLVITTAFFTASITAGVGLISGKCTRKTRLSFFPFLVIGYVGMMLLW